MDQQQIKVSFSVGTKLLLSIVSLLSIVILFLNISTILLFREDKRAYIYQTQSTTALLAGREFIIITTHALDTLRTTLATVDPRDPIRPDQKTTLQSIIDNQSEVLMSTLYLVNTKTAENTLYTQIEKANPTTSLDLNLRNYKLSTEWMKILVPELIQNEFGLINLSQLGGPPLLAVLLADRNLQNNPEGMPVAVGLVSLKRFGNDLSKLKLTITNRLGWVLYDSDPAILFSKTNLYNNPLFKAAAESQLVNGTQEFDSDGIHFLGSFVIPGLNLIVLTSTEWRKAMSATYVMIEKFILLGSMAIGVAIVFAILFSKTLTAPLDRLYDATKEVAAGNFLLHLEEKSKDEIGALSNSFNTMSKKIAELVQESMAKVQLENEIAIASTVQQTLIPPEAFQNDFLHIHSRYQPATQCGGDWWGFFGKDSKIAIMIADATGHGFPSALITASARSCFSVMQKLAQEDPHFKFSPSNMLSYANRVIYDASLGQIMMTFFIAVIDFENKTLTYSSAAHNPPWLYRKEGDTYALTSLTSIGQRLGEYVDLPEHEEKIVSMGPDDLLFLYTDGLIEGKNLAGTMYGKKRARKILESHLSEGPQEIIHAVINDFLQYNDGKELDDDVTLAALKILDPQTPRENRLFLDKTGTTEGKDAQV